ncbi:intermembrane phospholipid transport protein YdbH family protein [Sphingobium sp.]|uniref:intermembrane phospholipid transport protein YdbH family protein n=1 Tax=Sphingobium sp. TaxID=1912891 RepID=UPI003B3B2425
MEERDGEESVRRAWLRWLGMGTGSLGLVLVGLWTQRAPIAENFISRELNRRGVQANYDLVEVGLRTQRIENIVLGNPARPDLTARWVEVDIAFAGLTPQVAAVRAGGVRMRGSYRDDVLRLGELDKFRDPDSTAPFSLPDILLSVADARMTLDTDAGRVGMQLDGSGNLLSGFRGRLAAATPRASLAGCNLSQATAWVGIAMQQGQPHLSGPVRADAASCPEAGAAIARPLATLDVKLGQALDSWRGHVDLSGDALRGKGMLLAGPAGRIDFDGNAARTGGKLRFAAKAFTGQGMMLRDAALSGDWVTGAQGYSLKGGFSAQDLHASVRDPLGGLTKATAGTPVAPLARQLANAIDRAGSANRLRTGFALVQKSSGGSIVITDASLDARSGARVGLAPESLATLSWPGRKGGVDWSLDGALRTGGGGLPNAALRLARRAGGGFGGELFVDPYAAGDARLTLDRVRFTADASGATRFTTAMRLDGPLPDGRLQGLSLPVEGRMAANGALTINPGCVPLSLVEALYAAFALGQTRQTLCPVGGAMFATGPAGTSGGAEIRDLALAGRNGDNPMRLTADHARFVLGRTGFALANPAFSIGPQDMPTVRLSAASMDGAANKDGFAGRVEGAGGQIGAVPLILEQGAGDWSFAKGALRLHAAATVRDSQAPSRFVPLAIPDFTLAMKDGRITAGGSLTAPRNSMLVARTDIVHDLSSGKGHADLTVPGLTFGPGLQPEDVTPITLGVVANVNAKVSGQGRIDWTGSHVTSNGTFRTDNASLAAAFGPVEGLSGEIHFTDLIGLVSAPGQEVRIAKVNPGVEVQDGVVRYRLEAGQKVRIEGGGWPFSGGKLDLLPTTMNFGEDVDRYMTFRVIGLDAGAFIQAMELDNVSATGTFDGIMPLIFNAKGGRVAGGVLVARQQGMPPLIMPEGVLPAIPCDPTRQSGVLSYVGPVSNEQVGVMGKMAFDALKDLQYKCLTILMDGALDGEMVTNVVFNGVNRGKLGDAPSGITRSFIGLPFIFNVRIAAPFRGLMGTAQSFIDPSQLIQNSIGDQVQGEMRTGTQQNLAVQPAESDKVPNREPK